MYPFFAGGTLRGNTAGPFSTIQDAQVYGRSVNSNLSGHLTLLVNPGTSGPITFNASDSGTNGWDVIYKSTSLAGHSSSGLQTVTGWTLHSGSIYRAQVGIGLPFHALYEDGVRARKTRFPKLVIDPSFPKAFAPYLSATGVASSSTVLRHAVAALDTTGWNIPATEIVTWDGGVSGSGGSMSWFMGIAPVSSYSAGAREFTLTRPTRYTIHNGGIGCRFFAQGYGIPEEAGEFYYDSSTGYLYYWPVGNIATAVIQIPTSGTKSVVTFQGTDASTEVNHVVLDGFVIEGGDFTGDYRYAFPNAGDGGGSPTYPEYDRVISLAAHRAGGVFMRFANHCRVERCKIRRHGYHGVFLDRDATENRFSENLTESVGLAGYYFDGPYPGDGDTCHSNVVDNCRVQDFGELASGEGIRIMQSGNNAITNTHSRRGPANGFFGGAGVVDLPVNTMYLVNNRMDRWLIEDVNQDRGDVGAMGVGGYSSKPAGPFVINYFTNGRIDGSRAHASMTDFPPDGVFTDNQSAGQVLTNIKVSDVQGSAIRVAGDSGNHTVTNCSWGAFDEALLAADIGVRSDFPY
mgnify:CR=1 FL=1